MRVLAAAPGRRPLEHQTLFLAILALFLGLSLVAEFRSYARPDTGFLLDAAGRVLDGARLYVDVVEINPPLIIALNMVAVLLARHLHVSEILVYRLGFTAALLLALGLSAWLLRRLLPTEVALRRALVLLIGFVLFPMAAQDFGEREHLVLALLVPYLLLASARALGQATSARQAAAVGLLAGCAFALKPHFLLVWVAIEVYLRLTGRVNASRLSPETAAVAGFLAVYAAALVVLTPQYLSLVRLLAVPYGRFLYDPFFHVLVTGPGAVLVLFGLFAAVALWPRADHPELWSTIGLGTLACLISGAAQQKGLRYHFYPALGLATGLLGLVAWDVRSPVGGGVRLIYRRLALGVLAATVAVVCVQNAGAALGKRAGATAQFEALLRLIRGRGPGERVFVMSYHIGSAYPLLNYAGAHSASRFPQLWILPAEYLAQLHGTAPLAYRAPADMGPAERYLNQAVRDDLRANRPGLVIILRHARDLPVNGLRRLDYLKYFLRDPAIAGILGGYQLAVELPDYLVYERLAPGAARTGPPPEVVAGRRDVAGVEPGGARRRLLDPTLLVAALVFAATLVMTTLFDRRRGAMAAGASGVRGDAVRG